jgi:hypothetical protein
MGLRQYGYFFCLGWLVVSGAEAHFSPLCETLGTRWYNRYHEDFRVEWPKRKSLNCPSNESKLAESLYLLEDSEEK